MSRSRRRRRLEPAERREPVQEVEAERHHVHGDEDQDPQRRLERLQEGDQLRRSRLLKCKQNFINLNLIF